MNIKDRLYWVLEWAGAIAQVTAVIIIVIAAFWLLSFISKGA